MSADATPIINLAAEGKSEVAAVAPGTAAAVAPEAATTIKITNGELYLCNGRIIGYMLVNGGTTKWFKGDIISENGMLHRDGDLPAMIDVDDYGVVVFEAYYQNGKRNRSDYVSPDGTLIKRPAAIHRFSNGRVRSEEYCVNDELHRDDWPAVICYDLNSAVTKTAYCRNGAYHRDGDLPAYEEINSTYRMVVYYINGKRHRDDGKPAKINYHLDGRVASEEYWVQGREVKFDPRDKEIKELTAALAAKDAEMTALKNALAGKEADIAALITKFETLVANYELVSNKFATSEACYNALADRHARLTRDTDELKQRLRAACV